MRGYPVKSPELVAQARRLRDEGRTYREIGETLGVGLSTVCAWVNDPQGSRDRERKRSYRGSCRDCGAPTSGCDGPSAQPERCDPCSRARQSELTRQWVLDSIREWARLFGQPPIAADWNAGMALANGRPDLAERTRATGRPWPSPTTAAEHFGSWSNAIREAGFEPLAPGQRRDPAAHRAALQHRHDTQRRRERIQALWREGRTMREIAEALGVRPAAVDSHLRRMRADGWDIPYRDGRAA